MRNSLVPTVLCALGVVVSPALAVAPGSSEFEKGRQAYYSKDYALAIHQFQLAARKTDRDPTVHYYLANALALTGNYEEARKQYQKSIQVGPSSEAGKLARVGLAGITSPTYGSFRSASFPAPGAVSQAPDEGQSVRQFVQALNNQLADRKRLATWEAEVASYNQIQSPYLEYYGYGGYSRRRYRHVMPMYNGFYGGNNYIGYANYGNYGSNY